MYFSHAFRKTLLAATTTTTGTSTAKTLTAATSAAGTGVYASGFIYTFTASSHGLIPNQSVTIAGVTPSGYNGTYTVLSVADANTFTVYGTVTLASGSAFGTATGSSTAVTTTSLNKTDGTASLSAGQLGIYNQNFSIIDYTGAGTKAPFYIVQGSYYTTDTIGAHGGYKESVKSKMINPKYISRIFWVQAKSPVQQVVQLFSTPTASGGNVGLNADTTYRLRIDVKGSPALRFLSHNIYRVMDSYTGPASATNPTYQKDPVATLLDWKEQITMSPYFNQLVQARVYKSAGASSAAASNANLGKSSVDITWATIPSYAAVGQRVTGTNIPANAFITAISSNTATVTYPTQSDIPSIGGTVTVSFFNDLYGSNGGYVTPYTNIAATSGQMPTYVGQKPIIPGTTSTATGATIVANTAGTSNGAIIYQPVADAASFTYTSGQEPFIELTAAYVETKFGNPTFTVTDNYDLEPLKIICSLMDDSGSTVVTAPIGQGLAGTASTYKAIGSIADAGIGYVAQASLQAQGSGETVLRELILTGKYRQEAFGDGTHIDQFRMREIEANPGVLNMMTVANRNSLYNKLCILHNVPRFNNPSTTFDNDQYLIEIAIPNTVGVNSLFTSTLAYNSGGTITAGGSGLGDYILEASIAAGGVQYAEMI